MSEHTPLTEAFGSKLYEWLAEFGVDDASARARQVAESFVRDGWSLAARTSTATADAGLRERVEAVLDSWRMSESRYHTIRAIDADLRAALATPASTEDRGDNEGTP